MAPIKKFITWLFMFLTSMFSGVDFTPQDNIVPYQEEKIYKFEPDNEPVYRHNEKTLGVASAQFSCRTGKYTDAVIFMKYETASGEAIKHAMTACWWEPTMLTNDIPIVGELPTSECVYVCVTDSYISAPYDCTLYTPSRESDGTSMELIVSGVNMPRYKITINNMAMWYCDVGRKFDGEVTELRHTYTADTQNFERGQVLGKAKAGETSIKVQLMEGDKVSDTVISLYDFFVQGGE